MISSQVKLGENSNVQSAKPFIILVLLWGMVVYVNCLHIDQQIQ